MKVFGAEEYGSKDGFRVICNRCGREADIVPIHHYEGTENNLRRITLEIRCTCGNRYGATIHNEGINEW